MESSPSHSGGTVTTTYDPDVTGEPCRSIVRAVAAVRDSTPRDLPPLYDTIDPVALAALAERTDEYEVTFGYSGCRVWVTAGWIEVEPPEPTI